MAYIKGNTYRFRFTATINGAAWNLAGATIKFLMRDPLGVVHSHTASIEDAPNGIAYYDTLAADLNMAGNWVRSWEIDQGSVVQESDPVRFYVHPEQG